MKKINLVCEARLKKYFSITKEAFKEAKKSKNRLPELKEAREDFLDMVERYVKDAEHFHKERHMINAFAALNYAHGWLDAGARIGLFDVHDSRLFTVDDE
ncbi:MAG: DUF357 domain-containing protein [archaeon]